MANIQADIRSGFYTLLTTGTTVFKTAITKVVGASTFIRLYYSQAPQVYPGTTSEVDPPYVIFDILPIDQEMDTATKLYRCTVQFLVASLSVGECENICGYISDMLEDSESSLTIGTYKVIEIRRQPQIYQGEVDKVCTGIVQYSIIIQK